MSKNDSKLVTKVSPLIQGQVPEFLQSGLETFVLAWTTTPWTLPSNTALTVGPKIEYSLITSFNQYTGNKGNFIVASELVGKQFSGNYHEVNQINQLDDYEFDTKKIPFIKVRTFMGSDLENIDKSNRIDEKPSESTIEVKAEEIK